jgi:GTP:adenosylcobinamide-phosphate guanylyltransferase
MPKIAILLLAAGQGARLGGYPKGLLTKEGVPLLRSHYCLGFLCRSFKTLGFAILQDNHE